jgi:hypothetical protein
MTDKPPTQTPANVPAPTRTMELKSTLEKVKLVVEICAFLSAGGFFVFHFLAGWFDLSLSTRIEISRVHDPVDKGQDLLAITARIKNGTGLIRLGDSIASVKYDDTIVTNRFEGTKRYDFTNDRLLPDKVHPTTPSTGLGPEEEIMLSTWIKVPQHATCVIDTAILIRRPRNFNFHQARSAAISLPLAIVTKSEATPLSPLTK